MPVRSINGLEYYLVLFDEDGKERAEDEGRLLSEVVRRRVADPMQPVTDIFITSHGWKGDIPAAIDQCDRWIGAMAGLQSDLDKMKAHRPGFTPVIIGLHWPSQPWGMEDVKAGAGRRCSLRGRRRPRTRTRAPSCGSFRRG